MQLIRSTQLTAATAPADAGNPGAAASIGA